MLCAVGAAACPMPLAARYLDQEADKLAYQVVKHRQRDRWSHGDLLRLAHPKASDSRD